MAKSSTETYRTNKASRDKHRRDNGKGGKYAHSNAYKSEHGRQRTKLKIAKGSPYDASKKPDGSYVKEHRRKNRGRGGGQGA